MLYFKQFSTFLPAKVSSYKIDKVAVRDHAHLPHPQTTWNANSRENPGREVAKGESEREVGREDGMGGREAGGGSVAEEGRAAGVGS